MDVLCLYNAQSVRRAKKHRVEGHNYLIFGLVSWSLTVICRTSFLLAWINVPGKTPFTMTPALENPSGATTLFARLKTMFTSSPYTPAMSNGCKRERVIKALRDEGNIIVWIQKLGNILTLFGSLLLSQRSIE